jgi:hypothetical protein
MRNRMPTLLVWITLSMAVCVGYSGCALGIAVDDEGNRFSDGGLVGTSAPLGQDGGLGLSRQDGALLRVDFGAIPPNCVPAAEACNQVDDDCDGSTDEVFNVGQACSVVLNNCPTMGRTECNPNNSMLTICVADGPGGPTDEICNGSDDDCDGQIDEGFAADCQSCEPMAETCNGQDDDCDGEVDEDAAGAQVMEACNGIDDDCDGQVDEANACPCPAYTHDNHVYLFCGSAAAMGGNQYASGQPWAIAKLQCQQTGFTLVKVDSAQEDAFLYQTSRDLGHADSWLGLNDLRTEGQWVWADESAVAYQNWDNGEPNNGGGNEDCGALLMSAGRESRWDDRPCDRAYHFICEQ